MRCWIASPQTECRKRWVDHLTHMLNRVGRIELETTIVRMGEDQFYLVCAAFFEQRLARSSKCPSRGDETKDHSLLSMIGRLSLNGPEIA
jgi:dimethylglycine dehydrogenase